MLRIKAVAVKKKNVHARAPRGRGAKGKKIHSAPPEGSESIKRKKRKKADEAPPPTPGESALGGLSGPA